MIELLLIVPVYSACSNRVLFCFLFLQKQLNLYFIKCQIF